MCSIDQEGRLFDLLFVAEFGEKQHGALCGSGLKQPHVRDTFVSGSTAAYSQCRSSVIRITVSSTVI